MSQKKGQEKTHAWRKRKGRYSMRNNRNLGWCCVERGERIPRIRGAGGVRGTTHPLEVGKKGKKSGRASKRKGNLSSIVKGGDCICSGKGGVREYSSQYRKGGGVVTQEGFRTFIQIGGKAVS